MMDEEADTIYDREVRCNYWQEYANCKTSEDQMSHVLHYIMTQYSLKSAIKKFGKDAETAAVKELDQLHFRYVAKPIENESLTMQQKQRALESIMIVNQKRDGSLKGRECADGWKQRDYIPQEDATSPTVHLYSIFITSVIDAAEHRDTVVVDLPGACLSADNPWS